MDEPDLTMISRRGRGETLVTSKAALELARLVHEAHYGSVDLAENEPLVVSEQGNNWIVRGSKAMRSFAAGQPPDGPLVMKISKFDAQILSYRFEMKL